MNRHNIHIELTDEKQTDAIINIGRAFNSPIRIAIMRMLNAEPMTLTEIANACNIQVSSAAVHMQILLDAGLARIDYSTKRKGHIKYFSYPVAKKLIVDLREPFGNKKSTDTAVYKINVGDYVDAKFGSCYGLASENDLIIDCEVKKSFMTERHAAQLLYTNEGYVTYALPNDFAENRNIERIELMLEICSEAAGYNEHFESDISFFINGKRLCVYTSPGDFGARYGKFTPPWWYSESTKYGLLVTIAVTNKGVWLNGELVNKNIALRDLDLAVGNRILLKIEVEETAKHRGGFNIFGEKFGDYDIPIVFTAYMKNQADNN